MPKLLVLFYGDDNHVSALARAAADGAKSVRFAEVDLRRGDRDAASTHNTDKPLESSEHIRDYEGVILVCAMEGEMANELRATLEALVSKPAATFANTVFGVVGSENTGNSYSATLGWVARLGAIMLTEPIGIPDPETRAKQLGSRTAKVVSWVRHALSHEHQDHHHEHPHKHPHDDHHHAPDAA